MAIEGELVIGVAWDGARVIGIDIRSTRPRVAGRLLAGRSAREAVAMLPRLYSICGHAHAAAARAAIDAAEGVGVAAGRAGMGEPAVILETVQEYLWRLLIDWPQAMGRDPQIVAFAPVRHRLAAALVALTAGLPLPVAMPIELLAALDALASDCIYGEEPLAFLARQDASAFDAWAARSATLPACLAGEIMATAPGLGRSATALMPTPSAALLLEAVVPGLREDSGFSGAPLWSGMTVETGALARLHDQPLIAGLLEREGPAVITRMAARLVELAFLLVALREAATRGVLAVDWITPLVLAPGDGLAAVQTARGLLLHRACVADGRVTDYQIVAPTEWNFHPAGPLVQGMEGMEVTDEPTLLRHVRLAISALDPCVASRIEIVHA